MKTRTLQFILNFSIVAAAICTSIWLYNSFGPNLPKVDHICIVTEAVFSVVIIILALTKKKWDKQD